MSSLKKKKILITGGTGYLGSNIINNLKHKFDFVLIKRPSSNLSRIANSLPFIEAYNTEELSDNLFRDISPDIIIHCATHYGRKNAAAIDIVDSNLALPLSLISMMEKTQVNATFINTDTILDKNISVYSLSKSQFKEWMHFFSGRHNFINIQLEHFYGPLDDKTKFVSFIIDKFINNIPELDMTAGEQYRYFTYIDDIVHAFEILLDRVDNITHGFAEFQVSADKAIKIKDIVTLARDIAQNTATSLNFGKLPYRKGERMNFKIDNTPIKNLGWQPKVSLLDGLTKTINTDKQYV